MGSWPVHLIDNAGYLLQGVGMGSWPVHLIKGRRSVLREYREVTNQRALTRNQIDTMRNSVSKITWQCILSSGLGKVKNIYFGGKWNFEFVQNHIRNTVCHVRCVKSALYDILWKFCTQINEFNPWNGVICQLHIANIASCKMLRYW